jgi:hypothetical protein
VLVVKPEEKRSHGRLMRRFDNNIRKSLKKVQGRVVNSSGSG